MPKLISKNRTLIKSDPIQSTHLRSSFTSILQQGIEINLNKLKTINKHYIVPVNALLENNNVKLTEDLSKLKYVYIFADHFTTELENSKLISVPYYSQKDNYYYPSGTCNVTSVAMCLAALGIRPIDENNQLEDELFEVLDANNKDRHVPYDLQWLIQHYGIKDDFITNGSVASIKESISANKLVIVHGYFTDSGHIIVINGYDDEKQCFIVNDPWGEYPYVDYDATGANLEYSYDLIADKCAIESNNSIWQHSVYK